MARWSKKGRSVSKVTLYAVWFVSTLPGHLSEASTNLDAIGSVVSHINEAQLWNIGLVTSRAEVAVCAMVSGSGSQKTWFVMTIRATVFNCFSETFAAAATTLYETLPVRGTRGKIPKWVNHCKQVTY